jgi:hypothetical protein
MGFFFLLAGYFTPASYNRKSLAQFVLDRLIRLGIPLAVFAVLLDPLTNAIAQSASGPVPSLRDFSHSFLSRVVSANWHSGPLWFAQALLLFSTGYVVWRIYRSGKPQLPVDSPLPSHFAWFVSALGVGAGALLIRQWVPVGGSFSGLQLGYFASYIFLFALGTVAWRRNWLARLTWKMVRPWMFLSIALIPTILVAAALAPRLTSFAAGFSLPAVFYAFWEPFVAWGIIATYLVWFRQHANQPSKIWQYLARRAYAVYILHAPMLVAIAVSLRGWAAPALLKFAITGTLASLATLALSSILLRLPGARAVL